MTPIRLATRGSKLALAQTEWVARELKARGHEAEVAPVDSDGSPDPTSGPGGDKARFVRSVELALLQERADIGIHSAKDLPADEVTEELTIASVPTRAPSGDVWIGAAGGAASIADVPEESTVGTASLRRRSQLLALRPDLGIQTLRGNIDTRLGRLENEEYDAIVLARAGVERLGRSEVISFTIPEQEMLPAAGQGALILQTRSGDQRTAEIAGSVGDPEALTELLAEREVVRTLEADCDSPVAVRCRTTGEGLELHAFAGRPDGSEWIRDSATGSTDDPAGLGRCIGLRMQAAGVAEILHPQ